MPHYSQIANIRASPEFRRTGNDPLCRISHTADMTDKDEEKNGGPNHLKAWMRFSKVNGQQLADSLGGAVTPGMVSDLANSNRQLSAKWLRRIAPLLDTTPGMLLDHDPFELPADMLAIWKRATTTQRKQLVDIAKALVQSN